MNRDQLTKFVESGLSIRQASEELGLTYEGTRSFARRNGVRFTGKCYRSIADKALDMRPAEAVDYLLGCLMDLHGALCGKEDHLADRLFGKLSPAQRRLAVILCDFGERWVTTEQLYSAYTFGLDRRPSPDTLKTQICHLRKKLHKDYRIQNQWGTGYRLIKKAPDS